MEEKGLTANGWATAAGVGNSLYNFLDRQSDTITVATLSRLAASQEVTISAIIENAPEQQTQIRTLTVRGDLSAGVWREAAEWPVSEQFEEDVPVPPKWRGKAFGLRIAGNSMNKIWPASTIVSCVNIFDYDEQLISGEDYVVVYQRNQLGHIEATAKRYELHGEEVWLCPESTDPDYRTVKFTLRHGGDPSQIWGAEDVFISAVILGGYRPTRAGRR